ncbi:hypothetical protein MUN82_10820 [Hymenobacter aerilatus]|uniref:Uncharacterized protein n=1 Tax=Hymenobacter aerilatus TaxID=2932251 RepID=A0A8T9T152_9BACT|nr:hypothetical protein [Hymenobacter aerilatus]UOR07567.1 hypothetical protein MUN82_10820 [Hymenobacter aerilatus]
MKTIFAPVPAIRPAVFRLGAHWRRPAWLRLLHDSYPLLTWVGWLHVAVVAGAVILWPLDHRTVTDLNVWIKPLKFGASGVLYLWTLGWLLADLPASTQANVRHISRLAGITMAGEIILICMQAARGTTSHFNLSSPFNGAVFATMGVLIMVNTAAIVWALRLTFRYRPAGSEAWVWGIRLGLGLFLVGSLVGGAMSSRTAHTVGAADGGAGLPLLGWSTRAGDLRTAHFLGLHALQALPLAGWLLERTAPRLRTGLQTGAMCLIALGYAGAMGWLYWQAIGGLPLLARP